MALELNIITAKEFVRLGAHGELDWKNSRELLASLAAALVKRGAQTAILDVRDATTGLLDEQIAALADVFQMVGFKKQHRLAVLHAAIPHPRSAVFAAAAVNLGFDVAPFDSYEAAVEWLSAPREPDPDFDRAVFDPRKKDSKSRPPDNP